MQASVSGSAKVQGTAATAGLISNGGDTNPAVRRAVLLWVGAIVILAVFHVGGAHF